MMSKPRLSPSHLPLVKQDELAQIVSVILQNCLDTQKIILFGSYARGTYKEEKDLLPDRRSGHVSDYDILAITSQKETALDVLLWKKISDELKKLNLSAHPKILTHDIEALNIKLAVEQYFYSGIVSEGITLHDSGKFELSEPRNLSARELQRRAQDHFDHWFKRAENFYKKFQLMQSEEQFSDAAFDLHQSAESAYKALLLVFANNSPKEHFLEFLGAEAEKYSSLMQNIFAKITKEDEERFRLFEYAYIGGRYDPAYRITKEDLEILALNVRNLLELTKGLCEEKIAGFVVQ